MKKRLLILILFFAISTIAIFLYLLDAGVINIETETVSFEVSPSLFKIILDKGDTINAVFNVENLGDDENFNFKIGDLEGMLSSETDSLLIRRDESKKVNLNISTINSSYGVHVGHLSVSNSEEKKVPVIISVHTNTQLFALSLNVAADSKQIGRGDDIGFEVKIFKLYDVSLHPITLQYEIFNLDGEKIFSEPEEVTVSSGSSQFTKRFSLPENIAFGDYVFAVTLNNLETTTTASFIFSLAEKQAISYFFDADINVLAILVIIFVAVLFFIMLMILYERKKLFYQLKKQHALEIIESRRNIFYKRKKYLAGAKNEKQKKKILEEFNDAKNKILAELRKQHRKQIGELKKLKEKKIKYQERKLHQWKKEGYSTALKSAQISRNLKNKLAALKTAYSEGIIREESYKKGVSELTSADKKLKKKHL